MIISNKKGASFGLLSLMTLFLLTCFVYTDFNIPLTLGFLFLGACSVVCVLFRERRLIINKTQLLYWMLVIVVTLFALAPNSNKARYTLYYVLDMIAFGLLLLFMRPNEEEINRALKWLEIAAVIIALYVLFIQFRPSFYWNHIYPRLAPGSQEVAMETKLNGYGPAVGGSILFVDYRMTIAVLIRLGRIRSEKRRVSFIDVLLLALYFAAVFVENRRGELLSLFGAVFCIYLLSMNPKKKADFMKKTFRLIAIFAISVIILFILYQRGALGRYQSMIGYMAGDKSSGDISSGRLFLWRSALSLFLQNPVFGIGWAQFVEYSGQFGKQLNVHNIYLQWLCETGVMGFILFLIPTTALFFMSFRQFMALLRQRNAHGLSVTIGTLGFGMQLFFLLLNCVDPAFFHLEYFQFFALAIMMSEWSRQYQIKTEKRITDLIPGYIITSEVLL